MIKVWFFSRIQKLIDEINPQKKPPKKEALFLGGRPGSNRRPLEPQSSALTS